MPSPSYKAPPLYDKFTVTIIASGISDLAGDGLVERCAQVAIAPVPCEDVHPRLLFTSVKLVLLLFGVDYMSTR
jgi:hypothetical protein